MSAPAHVAAAPGVQPRGARPLRATLMALPLAAGSPADVAGRSLAERIGWTFGPRAIVENHGDHGGPTGAEPLEKAGLGNRIWQGATLGRLSAADPLEPLASQPPSAMSRVSPGRRRPSATGGRAFEAQRCCQLNQPTSTFQMAHGMGCAGSASGTRRNWKPMGTSPPLRAGGFGA